MGHIEEIPELKKKSGTALVLSGGATKAFYFHLGVMNILRPDDISSIVGSSAGAVMGAFLASGIAPETLISALHQGKVYIPKFDAWVKSLTSGMLFRPNYVDIAKQAVRSTVETALFLATMPWLRGKDVVAETLERVMSGAPDIRAIFNSGALEELFRTLLPSPDFRDTEIDLYVTATALDSKTRAVFNSVYDFECHEDAFMTDVPIHRAIRASTAVPGLFDPVKIKGQYWVDGEIKRTLSADIGVSLADRIIISHTYQPLWLENGATVADMGAVNILRQSVITVVHERINRWRERFEEKNRYKEVIWIQPEPDDIEFFLAPEFSFSYETQKRLIRSGELAALKVLGHTK
ncbi:MAG: patatin-like phospholipase family protein [bacterium]|nr:patatin-like phospholipase family protein [bacterium]